MLEKRWLTVKDCALYLGLTESAVYNMIHRLELPYSKLGNRVRIDRYEVDQQMLRTRREPTSSNKGLKKDK